MINPLNTDTFDIDTALKVENLSYEDYQEICKQEFYRSVTVFRKSISAMRAALKTNKPEIIDNMEAQVKELQEQIDKNKASIRGN